MIYALYLGIGLLFGFILARFLKVPPEQQTVCIIVKADGKNLRQTCISSQADACIEDMKASKE